MSKRLKNYPDPSHLFKQYGVDATRYYLFASPVLIAENLNFSEEGVRDSLRKIVMILWNVYKFYAMYEKEGDEKNGECLLPERENILDKWILIRLNTLIKEVTQNMNGYNIPKAVRPIDGFINDFSTWYIRRSRDRFKSDNQADKKAALNITKYVLMQLAKVMAPFMPFIAEQIWQKTTGYNFKDENKSVHLVEWPLYDDPMEKEDAEILKQMEEVRKIVELGLAKRDEAGIKVRQPLATSAVGGANWIFKNGELINLIKDELNVKDIVDKKGKGELVIELDTIINDELKLDGLKREIVRTVNNLRKNAGLTIQDKIVLSWQSDSELIKNVFTKMADELKKDTLSEKIIEEESENEVKVNGEKIKLGIKRI
jgi:isoleucyl-tRNA synthetase